MLSQTRVARLRPRARRRSRNRGSTMPEKRTAAAWLLRHIRKAVAGPEIKRTGGASNFPESAVCQSGCVCLDSGQEPAVFVCWNF